MIRLFKIWESKKEEEVDERAVERYIEIARLKTKIASLRSMLPETNYVHPKPSKPTVTQKEKKAQAQDTAQQERNAELNDLKAKLMRKK